jgi:hypothetical protein
MMQTRTTIFAGRPVFQHPIEPILLGVPPLPRDGTKSHVELQPLSDDEARGVPPEHIFEIRDARGAVIDTNTVRLQLWAIPDGVDPAKYEAIGLSDTSRQIWRVSFASHTNPPPSG